MTEEEASIWHPRLTEGLALLEQVVGTTCECDEIRQLLACNDGKSQALLMHLVPDFEMDDEGNINPQAKCIQCYARRIANNERASALALEDATKEVLCHIDDFGVVEFTAEHPVEAIRYWASLS